jgi:3-dehydroquinate synthase II
LKVDGSRLVRSDDPTKVSGAVVRLEDSSGQEQALAVLGSVEWLLVDVVVVSSSSSTDDSSSSLSKPWQMIPAENIVSASHSTGTKLAFCVHRAEDVSGLANALELGVDALCVSTKSGDADPDLWRAAFGARRERTTRAAAAATPTSAEGASTPAPEIVVGSCWRRDTQGTVLADRICVDLVQKLKPEEGCWVGSSAKTMALVLSEAAVSSFVPTRPFRVNAGPVHSYILLGDGATTKYLSELRPADAVQVYNARTNSSRVVAVGRLKEEIRPCVLVELDTTTTTTTTPPPNQPSRGQVFLQQAETVRLAQPSGTFLRVTDLKAQSDGNGVNVERNSILLRTMTTGTHVGKVYTGKVEER